MNYHYLHESTSTSFCYVVATTDGFVTPLLNTSGELIHAKKFWTYEEAEGFIISRSNRNSLISKNYKIYSMLVKMNLREVL